MDVMRGFVEQCERGLMTAEELDRLLDPASMTAPKATPAKDR